MGRSRVAEARPFLKWAGGKRQLLPQLEPYLLAALEPGTVRRYVEPFVGSGAVFFHLAQRHRLPEAVLSDLNPELIQAYVTVQQEVEALIAALAGIETAYLPLPEEARKEFYYAQRARFNAELPRDATAWSQAAPGRTARLIFLNRTCYNGLFRVNASGAFNVPFGRYQRPRICDAPNLRAVSRLLQGVQLHFGHYRDCAAFVDRRTLVYFDPPYRPLTPTASFTAYSRHSFDDEAQLKLARFFRELDGIGAKLLLSNSDPQSVDPADRFFEEAYAGYRIVRVLAARRINSRAERRGPVSELLIANY